MEEIERERERERKIERDRLWERKRKISNRERSTYIMTFKRIDGLREIEKQNKNLIEEQ